MFQHEHRCFVHKSSNGSSQTKQEYFIQMRTFLNWPLLRRGFCFGFFQVPRSTSPLSSLFIPYNFPLACLARDYPACKLKKKPNQNTKCKLTVTKNMAACWLYHDSLLLIPLINCSNSSYTVTNSGSESIMVKLTSAIIFIMVNFKHSLFQFYFFGYCTLSKEY